MAPAAARGAADAPSVGELQTRASKAARAGP